MLGLVLYGHWDPMRAFQVMSGAEVASVQVEALAGCRVLHVACGVWHTAAVAAHVPGFGSLQQGSAEVDPAEWDAIQQKMAAAYDVLDEVRCMLLSPPAYPLRCAKVIITPRIQAEGPTVTGPAVLHVWYHPVTGAMCCLRPATWGVIWCAHSATSHHQLASIVQEGGQLYTWGGAFENSATQPAPLMPRLPAQQDNHQGCLGHGDKAGRLTPTRSAAAGR